MGHHLEELFPSACWNKSVVIAVIKEMVSNKVFRSSCPPLPECLCLTPIPHPPTPLPHKFYVLNVSLSSVEFSNLQNPMGHVAQVGEGHEGPHGLIGGEPMLHDRWQFAPRRVPNNHTPAVV